jgi:hypothetical protein
MVEPLSSQRRALGSERSRREIGGQVPLDVRGVGYHGREKPRLQLGREGPRGTQQQEDPAPRDEAERHLEAAGPVDADAPWVLRHPMVEVPSGLLGIPLVARESMRLRQRHEPLMAAQLPDHLAVPDGGRFEGVDASPWHARGLPAGDRIAMPVDGMAEVEAPIAEQVEPFPQRRLGRAHDPGARLRHPLAQKGRDLRVADAPKEAARAHGQELLAQAAVVQGDACAVFEGHPGLQPLGCVLPAPRRELGEAHLPQAAEPHAAAPP